MKQTTQGGGDGGIRIELTNDLSEVEPMIGAVEQFCEGAGADVGVVSAIMLAVEELVTNVIDYGHPAGGRHQILVDMAVRDGVFTARVEDDGIAYNPLTRSAPRLDVPLEERQVGGLGVHLVKNLMDEVTYARQHDRNVLTIRKTISPGGPTAG